MTAINAEREQDALDFMRLVVSKLRRPRNVAKDDWRMMSSGHLFDLMRREVQELRDALGAAYSVRRAGVDSEETMERFEDAVREECLDVAAFAWMVHEVIAIEAQHRTAGDAERALADAVQIARGERAAREGNG